jgi:polyhydroxybutyrate depolymerase
MKTRDDSTKTAVAPRYTRTIMRLQRIAPLAALLLAILARSTTPLHAGEITIDLGRGAVAILIPSGYDPDTPTPLLILLHGYTSSGAETEAALQFAPEADARGMLYAFPDGTVDSVGNRFWNATDACCNFFGSAVDDVAYLRSLIQAIGVELNVDPSRVFIAGHSNGGFMAYRFACDQADVVAAVVSVAGATFENPADCAPSRPVRTLQIHGTADGTIDYNGGFTVATYPGAIETTETWATYNGCDSIATTGLPPRDLDATLPGAETTVMRYESNCRDEASASLWTIEGGAHVPDISATFASQVASFLLGPATDTVFADGFESGDTSAWSALLP